MGFELSILFWWFLPVLKHISFSSTWSKTEEQITRSLIMPYFKQLDIPRAVSSMIRMEGKWTPGKWLLLRTRSPLCIFLLDFFPESLQLIVEQYPQQSNSDNQVMTIYKRKVKKYRENNLSWRNSVLFIQQKNLFITATIMC